MYYFMDRCNVNGPTAHWSDDTLVRKSIGPKKCHWSYNGETSPSSSFFWRFFARLLIKNIIIKLCLFSASTLCMYIIFTKMFPVHVPSVIGGKYVQKFISLLPVTSITASEKKLGDLAKNYRSDQ